MTDLRLPFDFEKPPPLPLPPPSSRSSASSQISSSSSSSSTPKLISTPHSSRAPSPDSEDINPDDTLRLKILGHGSSGKVYKVQHKRTGKLYALKIIQEKQEAAVCKRILTEVDILRRASVNPNVVQCYGAYEKGGEISFVLEYMEGGSLTDMIEAMGKKGKKMSERQIAWVAREVLKGLDYLHRNRIVHRDIKPSNVLLGGSGGGGGFPAIKIADFGVSAVLANTLAGCNTFVGTCAYMSPERFDPDSHGGNYSGYAADIWSLGLSLLECCLGYFPFLSSAKSAQSDWPTLMFAICYNNPPSAPPSSSLEFRDFISQCLQKDPTLRPRASSLLSHPFITKFVPPPSPHTNVQAPTLAAAPVPAPVPVAMRVPTPAPAQAPVLARVPVTATQKRQAPGRHFWESFTKAVGSIFS